MICVGVKRTCFCEVNVIVRAECRSAPVARSLPLLFVAVFVLAATFCGLSMKKAIQQLALLGVVALVGWLLPIVIGWSAGGWAVQSYLFAHGVLGAIGKVMLYA